MSFVVLVAALVTGSVILEDSFVEESSLVYHTSLACQKSRMFQNIGLHKRG